VSRTSIVELVSYRSDRMYEII